MKTGPEQTECKDYENQTISNPDFEIIIIAN